MNGPELIIRSQRVVTPEAVGPAAVYLRAGVITELSAWDNVPPEVASGQWSVVSPNADAVRRKDAVTLLDVGDAVVMPGLVDSHVHVNEPGRTAWEGFASATRAAAAGGVTTLVDMPLNSIPPTTTRAGLAAKLAAARGQCWIDVAFWGGVVPGNTHELRPLWQDGVRGYKCFLVHSGVDEFPHVNADDLRAALPELADLGSVLLVHAEMPGPIERAAQDLAGCDPQAYQTFLRSRPRASENEAVALMIELCRATGARVHIVHHSSADALPLLRAARAEGLPLTVETCPHYLTFAAEDIPDSATHFKCCPPVRERENREQLWAALADGVIDMVVSDHSPCTPALKLMDEGDFLAAWGGIASLQFGLPVMWTQAQARGFGLRDITRWMSEAPARLAGLQHRKGRLAAGYDADIVIWQPEAEFQVVPDGIHHRHKITPYSGLNLRGVVQTTFVRGVQVYEHGQFAANATGLLLT